MHDGKINEAEQYLNDMRTKINSLSTKIVSGDDMVDSLISSRLQKMSEKGSAFSMDGVIDGDLECKPIDICTVFANMIDNAIESASHTENGFIKIEFRKQDISGLSVHTTAVPRMWTARNCCPAEDILQVSRIILSTSAV